MFKDEPLVHIAMVDSEAESHLWNDVMVGRKYLSSHWNREAGKKYELYTYTNGDEVELLVNGESMGVQKNPAEAKKRNTIYWKGIPFAPGKITAIARREGKEVARHELETTGEPVALTMETENPTWKSDGMDLQYARIHAVDSNGRKVPTASNEIAFEVSGSARLIAVDNGDHSSGRLFDGNKTLLHKGFAMVILRAKREAGSVRLKVTGLGLNPVEKIIPVR